MATAELQKPDIVIRGRKVVGGVVEGEALTTTQTISGWGGVNPMKGEIIESHQGKIRVESTLGVGTAITLKLPIAHAEKTSPATMPLPKLGVPVADQRLIG